MESFLFSVPPAHLSLFKISCVKPDLAKGNMKFKS